MRIGNSDLHKDALLEALQYVVDSQYADGSTYNVCELCDMGDTGYSSKGPNNHDDIPNDLGRVCPVVKAREAILKYKILG